MSHATINRRDFLGKFLTVATGAAGLTASNPSPVKAQDLEYDIDDLFRPTEKENNVAQETAINASWALELALRDNNFVEGLEFVKTQDGKFFPLLQENDIKYLQSHLEKYLKERFGREIKVETAVDFSRLYDQQESSLRGRTFFLTKEPIRDAAKNVCVGFAREIVNNIRNFIKENLDKIDIRDNDLYKYLRNFLYTNLFLIGNSRKSPEGWHVFSHNGYRIEYRPEPNATETTPKQRKGKFVVRNNYNMSITEDPNSKSKNKMFTVGMGHNHIVLHNTALISYDEDTKFAKFKALDPQKPNSPEEMHLVTHSHEIVPADKVQIYQLAA